MSRTTNETVTYAAVFSGAPTQPGEAVSQASAQTPSGGVDLRWLLVLPLGAAAAGLFFGGKLLLKKHKSKKEWEEYTK